MTFLRHDNRPFTASDNSHRLSVRWLVNPGEHPRENCCITIENGLVADLRPCSSADHIQPWIIFPPLVNAHTHLEFSTLQQPFCVDGSFPDWIRRVLEWRNETTDDQASRIRSGVTESRNAGVQLLGDIVTGPQNSTDLKSWQGINAVLFREVIALTPARAQSQLDEMLQHLKLCAASQQPGIQAGISPHAPYTVHPDVLQSLIQLATQFHVPVAMHLAETVDEIQLLRQGSGPFANLLQQIGVWDPRLFPGHRDPQEQLEQLRQAPQAQPGAAYSLVKAAAIDGTFKEVQLEGAPLPPGQAWKLDYSATEVRLSVSGPPVLAISNSGGNVTLSWNGGGTLQSSQAMGSAFIDVPGAVSPYTTTAGDAQRFFRVR